MKNLYFVLICMTLLACKSEEVVPKDEPTEQEILADNLKGNWTLSELQLKPENVDAAQLQGFQLNFEVNSQKNGGAFQATNTAGLIGPEGSWSFVGVSTTEINLTSHSGTVGNIEILLNSSQLQVSFSTPSDPISRTQGLDGDYQLLLNK